MNKFTTRTAPLPNLAAFTLACAAGFASPTAALAQTPEPIDVLCAGPGRVVPCAGSSFAFASGDPHLTFRNAVLDPSNFGEGGIVGRPIVLSETDLFTADALAGIDVVVVTQFQGDAQLLPCEVALLRDFVEQGGGLFAWGNRVPDTLMDVLGVGEATDCVGRGFMFVPVGHPAVNGPFGVASGSVSPVFACVIESLPAGATTLVTSGGEPMAAAIDIGAGRTVLMSDDEWAVTSPACPASSRWQANTRTFGLNAFAHVAPAEGFEYADPGIPCAICPADLDGDGELTIFDFLAFQNLFDAMDPIADFDGDGDFTIFDFLAFQNAFDAGCP